MASLQDTIDIVIRAQDEASTAIRGVGSALSAVDEKVQAIAAPFASIADKVLLAQGAITGLGAALVKTGVDEAGKFEQSFKFLTTLFDASGESVSKFRQDILDYASSSTQSLESITTALEGAIGGGVDYAESIKFLAEAEKLAIAQGATLDETTNLLANTLQAYGLSVGDAAKLSDQFSVTIRDGKVSASELNSQLAQVLPVANATGVTFDQVGAAIAVLTTQGYPAGQAITAIKGILEGVLRPTKEASDYASELGISFGAAALKSDGLQGVLQKVFAATNGNVDAMAKLFTTSEGLGGALALGGAGAEKFKEILLNMAKATGTTDDAFKKMGGAIEDGAQNIQNAMKVAFVNLGTPLLDEVSGIRGEIAKIFTALGKEFTDGGMLRPVTQALEALGVDIQEVLASIAKNLPEALKGVDLSGAIKSFGNLGEAIQGLFTDAFGKMDLTTVEGLRTAIQAVIDTITSLTNTTAGIVKAFAPAVEAIKLAADEFNTLDGKSQIDFGEFIGSAKLVVEAGTGLGLALVAIGQTSLSVAEAFDQMAAMVALVPLSFSQNWSTVELTILGLQKKVLEATISIADFKAKFSFLPGEKTFWEGISEKASTALGSLAVDIATAEKKNREGAESFDGAWQRAMGNTESNFTVLRSQLDKSAEALKSVGDKSDTASTQLRSLSGIKVDSIDIGVNNSGALSAIAKVKDNVLDLNDQGLSSILLNVETSETASRIENIIGLVDDVKTALTNVPSDGGGLGWIVDDKLVGDLNDMGIEISEWTDANKGLELVFSNAGQGANKLSGDVTSLNETLDTSRIKTALVDDGTGKLVASYSQIGEGTVKATGGISIINDAYGAQAKKVDEAIKQSDAYITKMEELASNERIKNMEFTANIVTTKLETDAERVKSVMEGISTTVQSTGDTISSLFGTLTEADSWSEKWQIENQISSENEERKKTLELQKRLTEAEIQRIQAQTRRLNQGDTMIKIQADGLEPEIEAFMWKILGKIQTRANASMQDYLLGIESAT